MWLKVFQSLLPRSRLWRLTIDGVMRRFFDGLGNGAPTSARTYVDEVWEDAFPATTRELAVWERQFGMPGTGTEAARRTALEAEWKLNGGQSISYIEQAIHDAGFDDLYVHEWFEPGGPPFVARDPRSYTSVPLIGLEQCTGYDGSDPLPSQPQCSSGFAQDGTAIHQPQCSNLLANEPGYLVNKTLTGEAPPPVPSDPAKWPFFIYVCSETFGVAGPIDEDRRAELERLLLKICPAQHWIVLLVTSIPDTIIYPHDAPEESPSGTGMDSTGDVPTYNVAATGNLANWQFENDADQSVAEGFLVPDNAVNATVFVHMTRSLAATPGTDAYLECVGRYSETDYGTVQTLTFGTDTVSETVPTAIQVATGTLAELGFVAAQSCEVNVGRAGLTAVGDDSQSDLHVTAIQIRWS